MASYLNELPEGWVQQYDERSNHAFWVDTRGKPPRSIWVHPYEDEIFLNQHPDIRERLTREGHSLPGDNPPPYSPRRHSYSGSGSVGPSEPVRNASSQPGTPGIPQDPTRGKEKHRGFFGKLKDKAIGTKEEREEAKRREQELYRQMLEQRRQQRLSAPVGFGGMGMGGPGRYGPPGYAPPTMNPYNYSAGPGLYGSYGARRRRGGFGGAGLPLLGGLAGGLLLGDLLDDGFHDGYGGGDWGDGGGGDFGGGDFGGGDF